MERKSSDEVREQRCDWAAKTLLIFTVRLAFVFVFAFWFAFAGKLFLIYYSSTNAEKRPSAKKKLKKKKLKTREYIDKKKRHTQRGVFGRQSSVLVVPPPLQCSTVPMFRSGECVLVGQWWTRAFVVAWALFWFICGRWCCKCCCCCCCCWRGLDASSRTESLFWRASSGLDCGNCT